MVHWQPSRRLYLDIETSGLNPDPAVILSMAAMIESDTPETGSVFLANILPTKEQWAAAHPKALEVNGMTWDFLVENGKPLPDVEAEFISWLLEHGVVAGRNYYVVGQNIQFDLRFLLHFMGPGLEWAGFPFGAALDVKQLAQAYAHLNPEFSPKNYKGTGIAAALGVKQEDDVHTAMGGVLAVRRNYVALTEHMEKFYAAVYETA